MTQIDGQSEALRLLSNHLVGLGYWKGDSELNGEYEVCSGFLLEISGVTFVVTAGHVANGIRNLLAKGFLHKPHLVDIFGTDCKDQHRVPIPLSASYIASVDDDDGFDCGLVLVPPTCVRMLEFNGIRALHEKDWATLEREDFERYVLVGIPTQRIEGEEALKIEVVGLPVERLPSPPTGHEKSVDRFAGRLLVLPPSGELDGLSGGPIFGLRREGATIRYFIVAIQSSWVRSKGIVFGCPLNVAAGAFKAGFDDAMAKAVAARTGGPASHPPAPAATDDSATQCDG